MPSLLQSNSYESGSAAPAGSVAVTVIVAEPPSSIGPSFVTETIVGATLFTVTEPVYSLTPPSLSFTLPLTERVPLSVVEQVFVLLAPKAPWLSVTVSETVKLPLSVHVIVGFCAVVELNEHGAPPLTLHA